MSESRTERLWNEYSEAFESFDDLTLARWLSQTLGQLQGRAWRYSHPLINTYRLAAELAHDRQIWLKRLANTPSGFTDSPCCRAPSLPLFTRDTVETGLICMHCAETLIAFEDLPADLQASVREWSASYAPIHAVAHWEDRQRKEVSDYDDSYEDAAEEAEKLLALVGKKIIPPFLDHYPAIIWEDEDQCLEVRPDDIEL